MKTYDMGVKIISQCLHFHANVCVSSKRKEKKPPTLSFIAGD